MWNVNEIFVHEWKSRDFQPISAEQHWDLRSPRYFTLVTNSGSEFVQFTKRFTLHISDNLLILFFTHVTVDWFRVPEYSLIQC